MAPAADPSKRTKGRNFLCPMCGPAFLCPTAEAAGFDVWRSGFCVQKRGRHKKTQKARWIHYHFGVCDSMGVVVMGRVKRARVL
jgi:hypothetical protein